MDIHCKDWRLSAAPIPLTAKSSTTLAGVPRS
jgi:hypothetical protein